MSATVRFGRRTRTAVCRASDGMPTLAEWIDRIRGLGDDRLTAAVDGIWCGTEGRDACLIDGSDSMLCVGWYRGKVEWSYLS
jgi:hypothetical protein